ncbi:MAG: PaaI family thioesterase [Persicimonas sp.]
MTNASEDPIDLSAGPGHTSIEDRLFHLSYGRSFIAGPHAADDILRVRWYLREADDVVVGKAWFGPGAQGPPGHAHGGSTAAILDEALGCACWIAGHPVVAAELNTKFHRMVPLERVHTAEATVERVDGRKIYPTGRLLGDDGTVYAEATGLFVEMNDATLDRLEERIASSSESGD